MHRLLLREWGNNWSNSDFQTFFEEFILYLKLIIKWNNSFFLSLLEADKSSNGRRAQGRGANIQHEPVFFASLDVGLLIDPSIVIRFSIYCDTIWRICRQFPQIINTYMLHRNGRKKKAIGSQPQKTENNTRIARSKFTLFFVARWS